MSPAAFAAWLLTALGGFVMFATFVSGGGLRAARDGSSVLSPGLLFAHLGLAAVGLLVWIVHLVSDSSAAAWLAAALLVPLVVLGVVMLLRWLPGRSSSAGTDPAARPPEQWFPLSVVVLHGVGATLTVVLVLVAASTG